ncbi:MAG: hypothetical protein ACXWP6_19435 [Ktedonobacterales bacterium]
MRSRAGLITIGTLVSSAIILFGLAGCAPSSPSASVIGTPTPPGPTATPAPPPHALAWFQQDGAGVGQIWASVNDGPAHQVTHMAAPSGDCVRDQHWSPPVFSPDLAHIVGGWGSGACGDGPEQGDLYVIDAATGAASPVQGTTHPANILLSVRQAGWVNNATIWWTSSQAVYEYTLGAAHSTALGDIASSSGSSYTFAPDAVLRGNTLFFATVSGTSGVYTRTFALKRFDMTSHAVLPGSISLGSDHICVCSPGDRTEPGFDVSADGTHIVFQRVTASAGDTGEGIASSQFFYANADGGSASRIASYATSSTFTRMQFSPNGQFVSIARAFPSPSVLTASVTSAGASGDPNLHVYHPDGSTYAVWDWRGATLWTGTTDVAGDSTAPNVERFTLGTAAGSVGAAGGNNPWYTIGH